MPLCKNPQQLVDCEYFAVLKHLRWVNYRIPYCQHCWNTYLAQLNEIDRVRFEQQTESIRYNLRT